MRYCITLLFIAYATFAQAQTKIDSIRLIQQTVKLYDLDFTDAEADSMLEEVSYNTQLYKGMHKTLPANDIPYPFAFNPAPLNSKMPTNQIRINWNIPTNVELPANRMILLSIPFLN